MKVSHRLTLGKPLKIERISFFTVDMPYYKSDEKATEKILKAIEMCGEIDTDHGAVADEDGEMGGRNDY